MNVNESTGGRMWTDRGQSGFSDAGAQRKRVRAMTFGAGERKGFGGLESGKQEPVRNKVRITVLSDEKRNSRAPENEKNGWSMEKSNLLNTDKISVGVSETQVQKETHLEAKTQLAQLEHQKSELEAGLDLDGAAALQPEIDKLKMLVKLEEYSDKTYSDTFTGQFSASMAAGRFSQEEAYAWADYLDDPTQANRKRAQEITALAEQFRQDNAAVLADDASLPWLSQTLAGYLPQWWDQTKVQVGGALAGGALTGILTGGIGAVNGAKAGATAAGGVHSYRQMSGHAFKELMSLGIDEETARKAAKDEALLSAMIEMAETGFDLFLGFGKLLKGGTKAVSAAAKPAANKLLTLLGKYVTNIGTEWLEEGSQQAVSIANRENAAQGETGLGRLAGGTGKLLGDVLLGKNDAAAEEIVAAGNEGGKIAAMMGPVSAAGNVVMSNVINAHSKQAGTYEGDYPKNVDMPTVPLIELSTEQYTSSNGKKPDAGNPMRGDAIKRAQSRLGLNDNAAAYIPASNMVRNGEEYVLKITKSSLSKMLSPSDNGFVPLESVLVMDNLERIANNGVWKWSDGDRKGRNQIKGFDHLVTTVYIDGVPHVVNMRVRLVQEAQGKTADNVLYYFTPEKIVGIEKVDTSSPTVKRRAPHVLLGESASTKNSISDEFKAVNHGEQAQQSGQSDTAERDLFVKGLFDGVEGESAQKAESNAADTYAEANTAQEQNSYAQTSNVASEVRQESSEHNVENGHKEQVSLENDKLLNYTETKGNGETATVDYESFARRYRERVNNRAAQEEIRAAYERFCADTQVITAGGRPVPRAQPQDLIHKAARDAALSDNQLNSFSDQPQEKTAEKTDALDVEQHAEEITPALEIKRISEIKVEFTLNPKHDEQEFSRQLSDQEKGMNELTIQEYLDNRSRYREQKRTTEERTARQAAREKAYAEEVEKLQKRGVFGEAAEIQALNWLKTQAALHGPDQIAGGYADNVIGVGDKRVNSSIGAQWRYRIDAVDRQIQALAESMSEGERKSTCLNMKLMYGGK